MNPEILPEEATNLPPLNRFRFREAKLLFDEGQMCYHWIVRCGHYSINDHMGGGDTLEQALFNAGIDDSPTSTD